MLRPQTWYLALAAILTLVVVFFETAALLRMALLVLAVVATVVVIPLYQNRRRQASLCLLPMALVLGWYVLLGVDMTAGMLRWYHALPLFALLFIFVARKGILRDEKLIRSLDRIR